MSHTILCFSSDQDGLCCIVNRLFSTLITRNRIKNEVTFVFISVSELDQTNPFVKICFTPFTFFLDDNFDFNSTHSDGFQHQRCGKASQSWIHFTSFRGRFKDIGEPQVPSIT